MTKPHLALTRTAFLRVAVTLLPLFFALLLTFFLPSASWGQNLGGRVLEKAPAGTPAPQAIWLRENGESVNLSDFRGRVVLLNFWATWCGPCVIEMPDLDALAKKYRRAGLEVVAVSLDEKGPETIRPFYRKHSLNHLAIYHDGQEAARTFGVRTMPTTYLIDREGLLMGHVPGFAHWQSPALEKHIQAALKKGYRPDHYPGFMKRPVKGLND